MGKIDSFSENELSSRKIDSPSVHSDYSEIFSFLIGVSSDDVHAASFRSGRNKKLRGIFIEGTYYIKQLGRKKKSFGSVHGTSNMSNS